MESVNFNQSCPDGLWNVLQKNTEEDLNPHHAKPVITKPAP